MTQKSTDVTTLVWLTVGSMALPVVGWIVGVTKLWKSPTWSALDKALGAMLFPFLMTGPLLVYFATRQECMNSSCSSSPFPTVMLSGIVAILLVIVVRLGYAALRSRARPRLHDVGDA